MEFIQVVKTSGKMTLFKTPQEACHGLQFPFAWDSAPNPLQRKVAIFRPVICKGRSPNMTEILVGRSYCSYSFLSSCDLSVKARGTALLLPSCNGGGRAGRRAKLQNQTPLGRPSPDSCLWERIKYFYYLRHYWECCSLWLTLSY